MSSARAIRDFDRLASVYDETRQPLDPEAVERLVGFLREHGWKSVLEVGVGTGRIAQPLIDRGFRFVGVDASRGMLAQAARKGIPGLVRGNAYHLPFPNSSFDVALFVHVLHILDDAGAGLAEASRVGRGGALAIMDRGPDRSPSDPVPEVSPRDMIRDVLTKAGYPDLLRAGPRVKEREILRTHPPTETHLLSERIVTEPLSKQLDTIAKRAYRYVLDIPPDELDRTVRAAREAVGDRTVTYTRREMVVWWAHP